MATKQQVAQPVGGECSLEEQTELLARFRLGDRSAFAALVRMWEHRLLTIAYRVVGNLHDAEEVRQMVLVKLARSPKNLPEPSRLAGWLRRCIVNEALSWLRHRRAEARRREPFDDALASRSSPPAEHAIAAERSRGLLRALQQLDPELRALLSLRFDEGLTIRAIAEVVERPPMTVHSQITRAVGQLRQLLAADCPWKAGS